MGCASSAPFMGEGALGEIKDTANNMIESGEKALHEIDEKVHQTIDNVKEVVMDGAKKILSPSEAEAAPIANGDAPKEYSITTEDKSVLEDIMGTPTRGEPSPEPPKEMFRPTPAPSFEKPVTPEPTRLHLPTDENVDESLVNVTIDELIKETEDVLVETNQEQLVSEQHEEDIENSENLDLESDLPPTRWEALADCIVELPPKMSIDLGTGQLYAIVDDEGPKGKFNKTPVIKEMSGEARIPL